MSDEAFFYLLTERLNLNMEKGRMSSFIGKVLDPNPVRMLKFGESGSLIVMVDLGATIGTYRYGTL